MAPKFSEFWICLFAYLGRQYAGVHRRLHNFRFQFSPREYDWPEDETEYAKPTLRKRAVICQCSEFLQ